MAGGIMSNHKHDPVEYQEIKNARASLAQPHIPPHAVPEVVDRLYLVEKIIRIKEAE